MMLRLNYENIIANSLFLDIGNTAVKWCFKASRGVALINLFDISKFPMATDIWVSVNGDYNLLKNTKANIHFVKVLKKYKTLQCGYKDITQLGVDRWLAMIAAYEAYKKQNLLVIDIGSVVTFDIVLANGKHQGGIMMPGLKALHSSFAKFSTNDDKLKFSELADNTIDGWQYGVSYMLLHAIDKRIASYIKTYKELVVILTGGYAKKIIPTLNYDIKIYDNLVLDGLVKYVKFIL